MRRLATLKKRHPDRGATAVEYGLMVALIAAVIMGVVATMGTGLNAIFTNATSMF